MLYVDMKLCPYGADKLTNRSQFCSATAWCLKTKVNIPVLTLCNTVSCLLSLKGWMNVWFVHHCDGLNSIAPQRYGNKPVFLEFHTHTHTAPCVRAIDRLTTAFITIKTWACADEYEEWRGILPLLCQPFNCQIFLCVWMCQLFTSSDFIEVNLITFTLLEMQWLT